MELALVDSGVLVAAADVDSDAHGPSVAALARRDLRLVIPALCVAESAYLVQGRAGPIIEAEFLRGLADFEVAAPNPADFIRMAELVRQYADFPLGGTDASVVALAERYRTDLILTLDRRHFAAVRP